MRKIFLIISILSLNLVFTEDCDDNMLMFDCDGLAFCNNEPDFGFDCYVNNDGVVNVVDVVSIVSIILDNSEYNSSADYNSDGTVNVVDIVAIVDIILN